MLFLLYRRTQPAHVSVQGNNSNTIIIEYYGFTGNPCVEGGGIPLMASSCDAILFEINGSGKSLKNALRVVLIQNSEKPRDAISSEGSIHNN